MDSMGMMMARDKNGKLIKSAGRVDAVELPEKSSLPFSKGWFDSQFTFYKITKQQTRPMLFFTLTQHSPLHFFQAQRDSFL